MVTKALRSPRRGLLYALLGPARYRRLMADIDAETRAEWLGKQIEAVGDIREKFHLLSFNSGAVQQTYWLGVPLQKSPLDCWIYQEIITDIRPDLIVETGTDLGGSALFFASICDLVGHGQVVSIDVRTPPRIAHDRIRFIQGDSTSEDVLDQVRTATLQSTRTMVVLDSDHSKSHVRRELDRYREFVTVGSYLVVEDTNVNGHPVLPEHGPGPFEAVQEFLPEHSEFEVDRSREKFLLTYFPGGYLKRIA
jgi:cephalosporin hydroxylase